MALVASEKAAAPDLIYMECANILWKKVRRAELTRTEGEMAGQILLRSGLDIVAGSELLGPALSLAADLDHPAYDCAYLALALQRNSLFVSANLRLINKVKASNHPTLAGLVTSLPEAQAALMARGIVS